MKTKKTEKDNTKNIVSDPVENKDEIKSDKKNIDSKKSVNTIDETQPKQQERKVPQMVTVNGDKVTHAHVFKSNMSDDWFFTAKMNDVPLKPQKISKEDMEAVINKTKKPYELMQTYFPTKLMPKLSTDDFKLPLSINTPEGAKTVYKFNAYKETNPDSIEYGKYRFYAHVGDRKMSESASREDLNAYFDRVVSPKDLITKLFGERLNMPEHYKQFSLPEDSNIEAKDIRLVKNQITNRYEISVNFGQAGETAPKEISYDDRRSYLMYHTATKEQLAAKYLGDEIKMAQSVDRKQSVEKQLNFSR